MADPVRPTVQTVQGTCTVTNERGEIAHFREYQHRPLSPGNKIRLLKLKPPTPFSSLFSVDEYSLVEYELESSQAQTLDVSNSPYVAISYAWREPIFDTPLIIVVNGQRTVLPITCSAWEAVRRTLPALALHDKGIWIDQICINRQDMRERERHVTLTGEIFRHCWHGVIWLGEPSSNTKAAFALLDTLQDTFHHTQAIPIDQRHVADLSHAQVREELASKIGRDVLPPASDIGWTEIARLLSDRSWFSRLWTFQEATLCYTGDVSICCGPYRIPCITFIRAAIFMGSEKTFGGLDFSNGRAALLAISTFRYHIEHRLPTPLIWLLQNNTRRHCRDPRDRIYAFLSLRREDGPEFPIRVDYNTSVKDLYINVARKIIKSRDSLRVCLESAERVGVHGIPEIPSWVPDWTREPLVTTFERLNPSQAFFRASQRRNHDDVVEQPHVLSSRGGIIDTIVAISQLEIPDALTLPERQSVLTDRVLPRLMSILEARAPDLSFAQRAYHVVSTLTIGGFTRTNNFGTSGLPDTAWSEILCGQMIGRIVGTSPVRNLPLGDVEPALWFHALTREAFYCINRKFALLKNGLLALVPQMSEVDDNVAILHGSSLPLVIRSADKKCFTLIGSCFMHGAMYGEKVTWSTGDTIRIC